MHAKTLTFSNFDDVTFAEEDICGKDKSLITVEYSTISPGTELFCINEAIIAGRPVQPGYILTGRDQSGNRCFLFPSMAESSGGHCNIKAVGEDSLLLPLPDGIASEDAGFLRFINIGMHAFNGQERQPQRVAVIGLGPVGNLAAQTAQILGFQTTGVDLSSNRCEIAGQCGIADCISPAEFGERKDVYDLVIDTVVNGATLKTTCDVLVEGGECSLIGIVKDSDLKASDILKKVWMRRLYLRSGWEMLSPIKEQKEPGRISTEENLKRALRWMSHKRYQFSPLLSGVINADINEIQHAYLALRDNPDSHMCYMIKW